MPRTDRLSTYRTTIAPAGDGGTVVTYVSTPIVHIHPDRSVTLRSGGYHTVTTKRKMNQAAAQFGLPYRVWQRDFAWFVTAPSGEIAFEDGMKVAP